MDATRNIVMHGEGLACSSVQESPCRQGTVDGAGQSRCKTASPNRTGVSSPGELPEVSKDTAVDSYCAVVGEEILSGDGLALPEGGPCKGTRVRYTYNAFAGHERRVPHKRVVRSGNLLLLGVEHVLSDGGIGNAIKEQLCSCSSMVPRALHSQCALER